MVALPPESPVRRFLDRQVKRICVPAIELTSFPLEMNAPLPSELQVLDPENSSGLFIRIDLPTAPPGRKGRFLVISLARLHDATG